MFTRKAKKAKKHKNFDHSAYYNRFHPEIDTRMAECLALRAQIHDEDDAAGTSRRQAGSKKRNVADFEESSNSGSEAAGDGDEDGDDLDYSYRRLRPNMWEKQRVLHRESRDRAEYDDNGYVSIPGYVAAHSNAVRQYQDGRSTEVNDSFAVPRSRLLSCSELFQVAGNRYQMPEQPVDAADAPLVTDAEIDWLISLPRRKSSTILKSSWQERVPCSPQTARTASFNTQPVSASTEYNINDPPSHVTGCRIGRSGYCLTREGRRSARLALKTAL